eukprot:CAMPEP_0206027794 /NCGR_PEP_ID=MMETSP1464-20131121/43851_1 /ASSEMBLY_ACC=CAM_ASM_001124 /TAXON_ID=119497 /ORGANISM="Exanthemachrysis gayraliae, Strain RCC1523" /LENGTH=74 /DNA_ID=CAMNT_0053401839 /DNA_START=252 /DNA_END=473 /DNA_ORIENTATION=+
MGLVKISPWAMGRTRPRTRRRFAHHFTDGIAEPAGKPRQFMRNGGCRPLGGERLARCEAHRHIPFPKAVLGTPA